MAQKKKKWGPADWIKSYQNYLLEKGELIKELSVLLDYTDRTYIEFRAHFEDFEHLESSVVKHYFQQSLTMIQGDDRLEEMSSSEKHLTFLYVLMENISEDEIFLSDFYRAKWKDATFQLKMQKELLNLELDWAETTSWKAEIVEKLPVNPKKAVLMNHAISCILFFLKDKSEDKQDTDAYIEKTTDLLFKLSDTSALDSLVDFGKFIISRRKTAFA